MIKINPPSGEDKSYLQAYPDSSVTKARHRGHNHDPHG